MPRAAAILLASAAICWFAALASYGSGNWWLFKRARDFAAVVSVGTTQPIELETSFWLAVPTSFTEVFFEQQARAQFHWFNLAPGLPSSVDGVAAWAAGVFAVASIPVLGGLAGFWLTGVAGWLRRVEMPHRAALRAALFLRVVMLSAACCWATPLISIIVWYVLADRFLDNGAYVGGLPHGWLPFGIGAALLWTASFAGAVVVSKGIRRRLAKDAVVCSTCGYGLDELREGSPCSECGAVDANAVRAGRPRALRVAVIVAAVGAFAWMAAQRSENAACRDAVAWLRMLPPSSWCPLGLIFARLDDTLMLRYPEGCAVVAIDCRPSGGADTGYDWRVAAAFWPTDASLLNLSTAVVTTSQAHVAMGSKKLLPIKVGPRTLTLAAVGYPSQIDFVEYHHEGVLSIRRISPSRSDAIVLALRELAEHPAIRRDPAAER